MYPSSTPQIPGNPFGSLLLSAARSAIHEDSFHCLPEVMEPASANPTTVDMIRRFGGSTSQAAQWPQEEAGDDEEDRFDRMEKLIEKAMKRIGTSGGRRKGGSASGAGSSSRMSGDDSMDGMSDQVGSEHESE